MTGVELALAVVPLIIVLVEHHRTVIRKSMAVASSKTKNHQQLDFYNELYDELSLLKITLDRIKTRPTKAGHKESQAESIQRALGENAQPFQIILDRVMKSVNDLVSDKSVALMGHHTRMPSAMLSKLEQFKEALDRGEVSGTFRDRIHFTRNEKSRTIAMHRIQDGIKKLERFLDASADIFDQQSRASRRRAPVTRTRRLSEALYNKMALKWPRACTCRVRHVARLCLWNCCCADDRNDSDDSLDMVVSTGDEERGLNWQESTLHVKESDVERNVRFVGDPPRAPQGRNLESESLCKTFQQAQRGNASLQISFENGNLWQRRSKATCLRIRNQRDITLKSLLLGSRQSWSLKQKSILAVVLAHAALHCSKGPWLRADWNKEHVSFFKIDATQQPDLSRPFLSIDFNGPPASNAEEDDLFMRHSNPSLLSLGILLLEIKKGEDIESHWSAADLTDDQQPNENTNLTTALRLLEDSKDDLVVNYRKVVKACLEWDVVNSGRENEDFTKLMYEAIVEPLERELEDGFEIAPEHLGLIGVH